MNILEIYIEMVNFVDLFNVSEIEPYFVIYNIRDKCYYMCPTDAPNETAVWKQCILDSECEPVMVIIDNYVKCANIKVDGMKFLEYFRTISPDAEISSVEVSYSLEKTA